MPLPDPTGYSRVSLGKPAMFLIPSAKMYDPARGNIAARIHQFLIATFGGYTAATGNIYGWWIAEGRRLHYGEHRVFTVAFIGKERIPVLERFLADIARELDEDCLYLETGDDAWLIYPESSSKRTE